MKTMQRPLARSFFSLLIASALAGTAGCASPGDSNPDQQFVDPAEAPKTTTLAMAIEQAERQLDLGREPAKAKTALEEALRDPAITPEERDQATIALSRAVEMTGDTDRAIALVEELLTSHNDDGKWSLEEAAHGRLRKLLTGSAEEPKSAPTEDEPFAPIASALAKTYRPVEDNKYVTSMVLFGGQRAVSDRLGTYNVGAALRDIRLNELSDANLSVSQDSSRTEWIQIPKFKTKIDSSLTVFYFDLEANRIPARYDDLLPMPSARVVSRLERGEGVVAVRMRPNAPPVILLGAPRGAQLPMVEEAFAAMKSLPEEPVAVPVSASLVRSEIQAVMRNARKTQRDCYTALLTKNPTAEGRLKLNFAVRPDGSVEEASVGADSTLRDPGLERCVLDSLRGLTFPTASERTTVGYPLLMTP